MSFWDRFLASWAPEFQIKRLRAMQVTNAYESAKPSRTHRARKESRGPNTPVYEGAAAVKDQVRWLEQNGDIVNSVLDVLVANIVGDGIIVEPMVRRQDGTLAAELNDEIAALHKDWRARPEVTWCFDEFEAQRMAARSWLRDGEVFAQHVIGLGPKLQHGTTVPYSYEMLEADMVPIYYSGDDKTRRIVQGIELNQWRRPVRFWVYRDPPNEMIGPSVSLLLDDVKPIPAAMMMHLAMRRRIGQVRGVSIFAPVLKRIADIDEIDETERVAARVAAAMAAYIKKGDPVLYSSPSDSENERRQLKFEPGMIFDDLEPGEEVGSIGTNRPNNELIPFRREHQRAVAGGVGASASSISKDYSGNYSSQRQELVEQRVVYGMLHALFVDRWERQKYRQFMSTAMISGVVKAGPDIDATSLYDAHFSRPAMPWIDPLKEAKGFETLLANELESREYIIRSRGRDPRDVRRQREQEANANEQAQQQPGQEAQDADSA
ncbi:MAG: phage portal protein [Gammaproteobacteria bacterium]